MTQNSTNTPPTPPLKGKKLAFALAFIALPNEKGRQTQAALKAGVSPKSAAKMGSKWAKMADVAAYIRERERAVVKAIEEKALYNRLWVVERLMQCVDRSMTAEPVMEFDHIAKEMRATGEYVYDSRGAVSALNLLGKELGMFVDKKKPEDLLGGFSLNINLNEQAKAAPIKDITPAPDPAKINTPIINLG